MTNEIQQKLSDKPERLTPELVVKMLKEKRCSISIPEAEEILKLMRMMANIIVNNYLKQHINGADREIKL